MSQLKIKSLLSHEEENEDNDSVVIKDNREPNNDKNEIRSLSTNDSNAKSVDELSQKEIPENEHEPAESEEFPKPQTSISLAEFRKITKKLKRSELETLFAVKATEVIMRKAISAKLHLHIKKQQQNQAVLQKNQAVLQKSVSEQKMKCKNLDTVLKKLNEIQTQKGTGVQEPLVPLVITGTVGNQVDLSSGNEANESKSPLGGQIGQNVGQQPAPNE